MTSSAVSVEAVKRAILSSFQAAGSARSRASFVFRFDGPRTGALARVENDRFTKKVTVTVCDYLSISTGLQSKGCFSQNLNSHHLHVSRRARGRLAPGRRAPLPPLPRVPHTRARVCGFLATRRLSVSKEREIVVCLPACRGLSSSRETVSVGTAPALRAAPSLGESTSGAACCSTPARRPCALSAAARALFAGELGAKCGRC